LQPLQSHWDRFIDIIHSAEYLAPHTAPLPLPSTESEELQWVDNTNRQRQWIIEWLKQASNLTVAYEELHPERYLAGLPYREYSILSIDLIKLPYSDKAGLVRELASDWKLYSKPNKDIEWFKTDKQEKISCFVQRYQEFGYIKPEQISDIGDIEIFRDSLVIRNQLLEIKELFESTRKLHQKRTFYIRNKDKKQCNVMLPTNLIKQLDKRANNQGIKRSQLIQKILIEAMSKAG